MDFKQLEKISKHSIRPAPEWDQAVVRKIVGTDSSVGMNDTIRLYVTAKNGEVRFVDYDSVRRKGCE